MAIPRQRIPIPRGAFGQALAGIFRGDLWEGADVAEFERRWATVTGARHAIAVSSGRSGLAAILADLRLPEGAEVICPAFGYPVVPHVVRSMGLSLRFVDIDAETLGIDPAALRAAISDRTAVVIAKHLFGVPCRLAEVMAIAGRHGSVVIEDCAHCLGATVEGRHVGTVGRAAYFSLETSKMVNTLGGGMLITDDDGLAARLRAGMAGQGRGLGWLASRLWQAWFEGAVTSPLGFNLVTYPALRLASRGKGGDRFASGYQADHFAIGRPGRFTNYQARLGLAQLSEHPARLARRLAVTRRLRDALNGKVRLQSPPTGAISNDLLVAALFADRGAVAAALLHRGIDTKHHYMLDCSRVLGIGGDFPRSARAEAELLHLPAFPEMTDSQVDRVAREVLAVTGGAPGRQEHPTSATDRC